MRKRHARRSDSHRKVRQASSCTGPQCEALECRRLLSTINWINRDITSGALDNLFNQAYGSNVAAAKQVVDRAINDWENAIAHFHNGSPGGNTFVVEIYAVDLGGLR